MQPTLPLSMTEDDTRRYRHTVAVVELLVTVAYRLGFQYTCNSKGSELSLKQRRQKDDVDVASLSAARRRHVVTMRRGCRV